MSSTVIRTRLAPAAESASLRSPRASNQTILRAALSLTAAGLLVKVAAVGKEMVSAAVYGRSDAMDAFLAAFLIPSLLINLIAESMNQALIPTLIRVRIQQGHERARQLLCSSAAGMYAMLIAVSAGMALLAGTFFPLVGANFSTDKLHLAVHLFYLLLACVVLGGVASTSTAVLNSVGRFAEPALAPLAITIMAVGCTLMLQRRLGIWALALGMVAGTAVQALWLARSLRPFGYSISPRWYGRSDATRQVWGQFWPLVLSSVVASGGLLVDQAMAAALPAGSVSSLAFGGRYVAVINALLAGAISSALAPHFSVLAANRDWTACGAALRDWSRRTAAVSAAVALVLIAAGPWLVRITLQRGAFSAADTRAVAPVLVMYAVQIPFFAVSRVFYRFLVAIRRTDLVLYCGIINLVLDLILNVVLMHRMGVAGIALATSLWNVSTCGLLWFWSRRFVNAAHGATGERIG